MSANDSYEYSGCQYRTSGEDSSPAETEPRDRAERVRLLKAQIKAGTYRADIKDIALQLAAAMDPLM